MSKDNELAWALHTAARLLSEKYTITYKTVTTDNTEHDEVVIEYGHRPRLDDSTN
jgi:hypothetical protein